MPFQHGFTILASCASAATTSRSRIRTSSFFPERGLTKGDLVSYYVGVAELALPHLRRRPFHMKRFPNGVDGEFFHQKRVPANHPDYVDEVFVQFPSGHSTVFAIVDNAAALAVGREPRLHRAAHVALAGAGDRAARTTC